VSDTRPTATRTSEPRYSKRVPNIWLAEEDDLMKKLKDKKMAGLHKVRLEKQLADVRKITRREPK